MNPTIEQLEAAIAAANEKLAELKAADAAQAEKTWPRNGDRYWTLDDSADIFEATWASDSIDRSRFAIGNVFRTKTDAERGNEHRKVLTELRRLARESWDGANPGWARSEVVLYFNHDDDCWDTSRYSTTQHIGTPGFASESYALDAVKTIGAERLKLLLED